MTNTEAKVLAVGDALVWAGDKGRLGHAKGTRGRVSSNSGRQLSITWDDGTITWHSLTNRFTSYIVRA